MYLRKSVVLKCINRLYILSLSHSPLLHESPDGEPETVGQCEVVLEDEACVHAGVRVGPLVRGEPSHDPDGDANQDVREQDVHPDLQSQRVHEREELEQKGGA